MLKTFKLRSFFKVVLLSCFFVLTTVVSKTSSAQMLYNNSMLGTGMMGGGLNTCPYQSSVGDEAEDIADEVDDINNKIDELKDKLKDAKADSRQYTNKAERSLNTLGRRGIKEEYLAIIVDHVNEQRSCADYAKSGSSLKVTPFTAEQWATICQNGQDGNNKKINEYACSNQDIDVSGASFDRKSCSASLKDYQEAIVKKKKAEADEESIQAQIDNLKEQKTSLKSDYKQAVRDHIKEQKEAATEGGSCTACDIFGGGGATFRKGKTDWGGVFMNTALGIASMGLDNNLQKYIANQNARLGYSTSSYPSYGYAPYMLNALGSLMGGSFYGSIGGGIGNGAFGCANIGGSMYGGGNGNVFGYPQNYYGTPFGGGIFANLNGNLGYNPYANMYGNPLASMYGNPMFGINGQMGYNPMGGNMYGNPMLGLNGQMGYNPLGNMYGNPMLGLNGQMGYNPMASMYNPMGNGLMSDPSMQMQMQQMQMQMQQQYMNQYMQMQQRAQQNYMSRQQVVMGLQQEMQSLVYRLQQAQMGVNTGGYLDFSSGVNYYGNGSGNYNLNNSFITPGTSSTVPSTR